ncbi:hypothetical protein M2347_001155 [Chryseobacterium sp. H1D6B]|uniref:hypothetical protein n=1 Tax=Chryseobacterium sp. H1D6B TaxID=2940588 RepID=UPI0015C7D50B|nr:hypothetical protein [Chryseobacterium sp. H1D6B]MDH6251428.1 hypothetical protein [Chryseobacterium sp. H1D6B]
MMNEKLSTAIIAAATIFHSSYFCAQVGINTPTPQQALHVSGSGTGINQSIIRINGLNSDNNPAHENSTSTKRVFSDSDGNLVIYSSSLTNKLYNTVLPSTSIPAGTERAVTSQTFTLNYPSIVHITAKVGMSISDDVANMTLLKNGQARLFGSYYKFTTAPATVLSNTAFGHAIISHSTSNNNLDQINGQFYIEPKKDLYLPKGEYTVTLYGYSQDSNMNFTVNSINQSSQQMTISITSVIN